MKIAERYRARKTATTATGPAANVQPHHPAGAGNGRPLKTTGWRPRSRIGDVELKQSGERCSAGHSMVSCRDVPGCSCHDVSGTALAEWAASAGPRTAHRPVLEQTPGIQ